MRVCNLGWQVRIQALVKYSRGVDDLPVTPNPRWGGFKVSTAPLSRIPLDLEPAWTSNLSKPRFHESCSSPLRRGEHKDLSQLISGLLHNILEGLHEINSSKPSRERQLPRVTSRWRLVEDSLVPQSSNSWYNALGCSHTHKNAIPMQRVCDRGGNKL